MALVLRIVRALLSTVVRASALFVGLFVAYMALTQAWPAYRALADAAAQRPVVEQQVMRFRAELQRREARTEQLRRELETLAANELANLRQNVESFEASLRDVEERREKLVADLRDAEASEAEYCESWNPLKRWLCREVSERVGRTRAAIEPLLAEVAAAHDGVVQQLHGAREALRRYEELPVDQRGTTTDAQRLRAELSEQLHELAIDRQALTEAEANLVVAQRAEASPWMWVMRQMQEVAWPLGFIVAMVMVLPWVQRTFFYFVVMPWVERAPPLTLVENGGGRLTFGKGVRTLEVALSDGDVCRARADYVRPVSGKTGSQWLFDWRAPFVSYAAGLSVLTRIEGESDGRVVATLASPSDSDSYLLDVHLDEHPGFVFHPRHLVAVVGRVELFTVWRLFSVHAWLTGQVRYIGVRGTGRCVLEGFGDILVQGTSEKPSKIEQELLVGFDARLRYSTARTEAFLPYFLGRTPLVDDVFSGEGRYVWQKNTRNRPESVGERLFELFFGAVSKLLGF
jgi:uncharacterized protein (AIM24 family)